MSQIIYMLSGLGASQCSVIDLNRYLRKSGFEIAYLDLPGQYQHMQVTIDHEDDLKEWLLSKIPPHSIVMGYSLGGDLLLNYLDILQPSALIILDAGLLDEDFTGMTLQEEIDFTCQYIQENNLEMNPPTIGRLLEIRQQTQTLREQSLATHSLLLLLSDSPQEAYLYKQEKLELIKCPESSNLHLAFIKDSTHDLYTEKPQEVAQEIIKYLNQHPK